MYFPYPRHGVKQEVSDAVNVNPEQINIKINTFTLISIHYKLKGIRQC
jgi:hypothetical protein